MTTTTKQKASPMLAIYLGPEPEARRRMEALDRLAANIGANRSKLIQMIADGKLLLTVSSERIEGD
jgi:hypothetical protein